MMLCAWLLLACPQSDTDASVLSADSRAAAERGLAWLAARQRPSGAFIGDVGYKLMEGYEVWQRNAEHVGVTALGGMAFLAGGHVPGRGAYGDVVEKAAQYVLQNVQENGYISANETRMYSHAFATLFLAELHGMTERLDVRPALQRAVNLIVASQNHEGGWRYQPNVADADMSVTVCQVMALRAARNVGIQVPASTIDNAIAYVKKSAVRQEDVPSLYAPNPVGSFRYQPANDTRASFPLTAAGIVTLHGAGVYADEDIERGLRFLEDELRGFSHETGVRARGHYFFYYGHYYAVQAFHMAGGQRYRNYFEAVQSTLLRMQQADGSWPNETGPGPEFGTAVACLILQIPREYLPIFQR